MAQDKVNDFADSGSSLTRTLVFLLAFCAGSAAANNYYNQPLLPEMADTFATSIKAVGLVAAATQVGYSLGLFFIAPLGDRFERKRLTLVLYAGLMVSLLAAALAPALWVLVVFSVCVGLSATIVQQVIPLAASLASDSNRGQIVGSVMTGMTLGILLARTVSGFIGEYLGWREMYAVAAGFGLVMAILFWLRVPNSKPTTDATYPALLKTMVSFLRHESVLRESAMVGALWFACFGAFWATMASHLAQPPFGYGAEIAGLFGILGVSGATATRLAGRWADKKGSRPVIAVGLALITLAFVTMWLFGYTLAGLIVGTVLLDFGVFASQVSNQTRVFAIRPEARSRLNGMYMVCYYTGGALGSAGGTFFYQSFGWTGFCGFCFGLIALAWVVHVLHAPTGQADAS